jgi:hypothetical protein
MHDTGRSCGQVDYSSICQSWDPYWFRVKTFLNTPVIFRFTNCVHLFFSNTGGNISNTLLAHRLLSKVGQLEVGTQAQLSLVHKIFKAYHEDEQDIGDVEVLSDLADDAGLMNKEEVRARESIHRSDHSVADRNIFFYLFPQALKFLLSDELLEKVEFQMQEARAKGVTGVPFTIIDGKWAVSGGQPAPIFVKVRFFITINTSLKAAPRGNGTDCCVNSLAFLSLPEAGIKRREHFISWQYAFADI